MPFALDPRLEFDSSLIVSLMLCQVRLHHNASFPWVILIPQRDNVCEIIDLSTQDQTMLMQEIALTSKVMQHLFRPTKLNVANLGNIVPQLHVHVVARFEKDKAWPGPIWNSGVNEAYADVYKEDRINLLKELFPQFQT
jgi:diadenosine tetraphosphate (Ap4A) HIT family hydrolase